MDLNLPKSVLISLWQRCDFSSPFYGIAELPVSPEVLFPHFLSEVESHVRQHMTQLPIMPHLCVPWSLELLFLLL